MKETGNRMSRANRDLARQVMSLSGRVVLLEGQVIEQTEKIRVLSESRGVASSKMELDEHDRVEAENVRQDGLTNAELQSELRSEYGATQWARRMIKEILDRRHRRLRRVP